MRKTLPHTVIALALAWSFFPGTRELTEQVVHLVQTGHLAHSIPNDPDACPEDAEHGCQGPMHLCLCCHTVPVLLSAGARPMTPLKPTACAAWSSSLIDDPHLEGVFHPPKA